MGRRFWIAALGALIPLTTLTAITAAPAEAAPASISPTSYNFGAVHVWQTKAKDLTVTVSKGFHVTAANNFPSGVFSASVPETCAQSSDTASTKCVVTETFAPDEVHGLGPTSATLRVIVCPNGGGDCSHVDAAVKGDARIPGTLSPNALDFGSHPAGTKVTDTVTIQPDPGVSLDVVTIYPHPDGYPPAFSTRSFTPGCVQAGQSCTVTIRYDATDVGPQSDDLTIAFCRRTSPEESVCGDVDVALTGTATPPATLSPATLSFGSGIHVGASVTKTVTLKVLGDWHVTSTTTDQDAGAEPFSSAGTSDCEGSGPQTCTFALTYSPTAIGPSTGRFRVTLCAPYVDWWPFLQACTNVDEKLSGTSAAPGSSATSISFGTVKVGQRRSKTLIVKHDPGWFVSASIDPDSDFNVGECSSLTTRCVLPVNFDPEHIASMSDTLTVTLCRDGEHEGDMICVDLRPVKITGTGSAPAKVSPTSLSFGSVPAGAHKSLAYKVTSDPGWTVDSAFTTTTTGPDVFSHEIPICLEGAPCPVSVTFAPPTPIGSVTGRSTPRVCQEGSGLCVDLPSVKLSGKGVQ